MPTIIGTITRLLSGPYDSHWCVATLRTDSGQEGKVAGNIKGAVVGLRIKIEGAPVDREKYGRQFEISSCEILPSVTVPTAKPAETVEGKITRIRSEKPESGWHAFDVQTADKKVQCAGVVPGLVEGQHIVATGHWYQSKDWGLQFSVKSADVATPKSADDVLAFIAGNVSGLGPKKQSWIRGALGERLTDVLNGDRLAATAEIGKIKGIGMSLAGLITNAWIMHSDRWPVIKALQEAGIAGAVANAAYEMFRDRKLNVIDSLKTDPYLLAKYVDGITFGRCEQIWIGAGQPETAMTTRIEQGLLNTLMESELAGNTCVPLGEAVTRTAGILDVKPEQVLPAIPRLQIGSELILETSPAGKLAYRKRAHRAEREVPELLEKLAKTHLGVAIHPDDYPAAVKNGLDYIAMELSASQRRAVETAIREKVTLLTGQAGSGKTTTLKAIVGAFVGIEDMRVTCCAPTGMAAQRLSSLTEHPAVTIHRLLGYNPGLESYEFNANNPIPADVLIVDELSMIDLCLFRDLLDAVHPSTRVILVGDPNQLESVAHGAVLRDLINSLCLPHIHLSHIFRQGAGSGIITAADDVLRGDEPGASGEVQIATVTPSIVLSQVKGHVSALLQVGAEASDIQVLSPVYAGPGGVTDLNEALQQMLNPAGRYVLSIERTRKRHHYTEEFRIGDRVMQLKNNYDLGIFNGDLGVIEDVADELILIRFGTSETATSYPVKLVREELTLAYAMTIHKSQGSEFKHVVLSVPACKMWGKNLLYTAITRAKDSLCILQEPDIIRSALAAEVDARTTMLRHRIQERLATRMSAVI